MERADEVSYLSFQVKKASPVGLETPITLYIYPSSQILEKKETKERNGYGVRGEVMNWHGRVSLGRER